MLLPPTNNARARPPGVPEHLRAVRVWYCGLLIKWRRSSISFWRQPECPSPPLHPARRGASFSSRSASSVGSGTATPFARRRRPPLHPHPHRHPVSPQRASAPAAPRAREPSATPPSSAMWSSPLPSLPDADATGAMSDFSSAPGTSRARSGNEKSKSAHTEPQRRALLAIDPLIRPGSITPTCAIVQEDDTPRPEESILSRAVGEASGEDHEEGKHGDIGERDPSVMDIKLEGMEVAREEEALRPRRSFQLPSPHSFPSHSDADPPVRRLQTYPQVAPSGSTLVSTARAAYHPSSDHLASVMLVPPVLPTQPIAPNPNRVPEIRIRCVSHPSTLPRRVSLRMSSEPRIDAPVPVHSSLMDFCVTPEKHEVKGCMHHPPVASFDCPVRGPRKVRFKPDEEKLQTHVLGAPRVWDVRSFPPCSFRAVFEFLCIKLVEHWPKSANAGLLCIGSVGSFIFAVSV
ncbi:hypothetical protein B0H14DRAFT_3722230 [Mycena olivaceomarginata]|nr:hypothetical protein B0H14DRAFT_3722230 [Mycena olivaceomarginata]